jgi:coenzyme PQQ precursor peptide PqqA
MTQGDVVMPWSKPDFVEITLCMEVTAYVNTDDAVQGPAERPARIEEAAPAPARENPA